MVTVVIWVRLVASGDGSEKVAKLDDINYGVCV
jgi:hypothetical protein